jgi:hypothetical protein
MALSAMAMRVAQWILSGRQGAPPAGATAQDLAAAEAAVPGQGPPPAPEAGEGLPGYVLPAVPDFATGTPVPGVGGDPTQRPVQRRGIDLPPHETPANRLQELENYEWQAKRLFDQAVADLAGANPEENADAYQRLRTAATAAQSAYQAAQNAVTAETTREGQKKKPHTIEKREEGPPDQYGNTDTYLVTFKVDEQGNEVWDQSVAPKLLTKRTGSPTAGQQVDLQTAQANLARLNQQLAAESDPLKKEQLRLAVDQARFTLQQAQAKGPLDLQTAQLAYDRARTEYEQATDETSRETRRVALEQARVALQKAQQDLNRPSVTTVGGRAVGVNPLTGERVFDTDLLAPEDRARTREREALEDEALRRGQLPQNAYAAYTQERTRLQAAGQAEIERLQELQRQGALSEAQARQQWEAWMGPRQGQLEGLRAAAEEAQRKERFEVEGLQRAEDARVQGLNRQREVAGYEAGEAARNQLIGLAPQVRTPQFLQQYGSAVANMSARAGAPSAEAAAALPAGQRITADTFNPANFRGAIPDLGAYARQATERALAGISPAVAARIGFNAPALPTGDALTSLLGQLPYRGPLARLPSPTSGLLPTPGMDQALDIGGGLARTPYGPGGETWLDWPITG